MPSLFARATRRIGMTHIRYVEPIMLSTAPPPVEHVYREMERDFGMLAPPVALHAPAPATLAAVWLILRETLLVPGLVDRRTKEVIAAAVSLANRCPYCVEVHGTTLGGLTAGSDAAAVMSDRLDAVTDAKLRGAAQWARATGTGGGADTARSAAVFTQREAPEFIGVAVAFHYINRMVNVFLRESPLPPVPDATAGALRRAAGRILRKQTRIVPAPGGSEGLLPDAPVPDDLAWAATSPRIATTFARASAAIDAGGARVVPENVRRLVLSRLAGGGAFSAGLGTRFWLEETLADCTEEERRVGRLALLVASASYQVTSRVVEEFRELGHGDDGLIELTSWASLAAARQIGADLRPDPRPLAAGG